MKPILALIFAFLLAPSFTARAADATASQPNVLFIIADDASRHFGEANGCKWAKTPNIDRLAKQGLVFDNAYTPTSKCAPSRAAILTGRNPWQLEDAANHQPYFPAKFMSFSEALATESGEMDPFWQHAFGKRPAEQLFDLAVDPDCVVNLAANPSFAEKLAALRETLMSELKKQNDPRSLGQGDVFDQYLSPRTRTTEAAPEKKNKNKKAKP